MEGDSNHTAGCVVRRYFNPLPPHGGRLPAVCFFSGWDGISIHSLRMEGDTQVEISKYNDSISIHSLRMEGDFACTASLPLMGIISIHSLRMEGDFLKECRSFYGQISIHSLRMEGDRHLFLFLNVTAIFQSTPSAWRETDVIGAVLQVKDNFNPLPPHGGRPSTTNPSVVILIFQSTPSAWRETADYRRIERRCEISIHSLRMEGDFACPQNNFTDAAFQSTPSAWRETSYSIATEICICISIHSLRMEGDYP